MNWLDAVVAIIVLLLALIGWKNGVVRAVVALGGTALGLFLAGQYYDELGAQLASFIADPNGANVAGFIIIFLGIVIGAIVIGKVVRSLLRLILLGWIDNLGGAALGAFVGAALSTGLCLGLEAFPVFGLDQDVQHSLIGNFLVGSFPAVLDILPREFAARGSMFP